MIQQGWVNRNRILNYKEGWQYINVPLKRHSHTTAIKDVKIADDRDWKKKIFEKIKVYKKNAPYYKETLDVVEKSLSIKNDSISLLNCNTINEVCSYLEIRWNYSLFSEMNLKFKEVRESDDWALYTCLSFDNVSEYWNLPGGVKVYKKEKFLRKNINIKFYNQILTPYNQKQKQFEPGLSIIDVMMFNSKEEIHRMLNNYNFIT
jgi:hypothetical protein